MKNIILILIVLLAACVRLYRLDLYPPSLNWDEVSHGYNAYSIIKTAHDEWGTFLPSIFRAYGDYKLPVYIYLTVPFIKLLGLTVHGVRIVSALAGIGSVIFTYLLAKQLFEQELTPALSFIKRGSSPSSDEEGVRGSLTGEVGALLSALSMALSPWSVFLSRIAAEANIAAFFIISGAYYFLLGIKQKERINSSSYRVEAEQGFLSFFTNKSWGFALSGLLFGLSLFTYNSARIFTPLLLGLLIWIYKKSLIKEELTPALSFIKRGSSPSSAEEGVRGSSPCACHLVGFAIFLFFFTGMIYQFVMPEGQARFDLISVLDQGSINRINESRGASNLPDPLPTLLYNKATFLLGRSLQNYLSFFNPDFWFFTGGSHYQFNVPNHGLLYPIELPLILIGLFTLWKLPLPSRWLILGWLLLAPIPASPTRDNPHTLRIITMMPIPYLLIGLGGGVMLNLFQHLRSNFRLWIKSAGPETSSEPVLNSIQERQERTSKIFVLLFFCSFVLLLGVSFTRYWRLYTTNYRTNYAWTWQYGHKELVEYLKQHYSEYSRIFITKKYGEPHEFILFYWPWDPSDYVKKKQWDYHTNWYWVNGFDKFTFVNDWEIKSVVSCLPRSEWHRDQLPASSLMEPGSVVNKCLLIASPDTESIPSYWKLQQMIYDLNHQPVFEIYEKISQY